MASMLISILIFVLHLDHIYITSSSGLYPGMCGIHCSICRHGHYQLPETVTTLLKQRGPDSFQRHDLKVNSIYVTFVSSVLSLRGSSVVSQPLTDTRTGSVLCWNGEAWKMDEQPIAGNDSKLVFDALLKASDSKDPHQEILGILSKIRGPFACVFYDAHSQKIYFSRDCLGRRSLVKSTSSNGDVVIASICDLEFASEWSEVEADGVYVISLSQEAIQKSSSEPFASRLIPHSYQSSSVSSDENIVSRCAFTSFRPDLNRCRPYPIQSSTCLYPVASFLD